MTLSEFRIAEPPLAPIVARSMTQRVAALRRLESPGTRNHRSDLRLVTGLLALVGLAHGWNLYGAPGRFDDEGTYVAQAWASQRGSLAHYTYWYDHPPLGWIQIGLIQRVTHWFDQAPNAVGSGRFAMLMITLVSSALVFAIARRLELSRRWASVAVLLFALSPLAIHFQRMVFLDSIAVCWLLVAWFWALSPRRSLAAASIAGLSFGIAVLSKETLLLLAPAFLWQCWNRADHRNRRFVMALAIGSASLVVVTYPLLAVLRNELLPSPDHVSLWAAIRYQLDSRQSSGFILDRSSEAWGLFVQWMRLDAIVPLGGLVAAGIVAVKRPAFRPLALALTIPAAYLLRGGYLPYPTMLQFLPAGALCLAAAGSMIEGTGVRRVDRRMAVTLLAVVVLIPAWGPQLVDLWTVNHDQSMTDAHHWLEGHTSTTDTVIVDDAIWLDLVQAGRSARDVIWFYKVDLDSEVQREGRWRHARYLAFPPLPSNVALPKLTALLGRSTPVVTFGTGLDAVTVYEVNP